MTDEQIWRLIWDLCAVIEELAPDEEYRGMYNIDVVLEDAINAINLLKERNNG
jgi:hypothetical protein